MRMTIGELGLAEWAVLLSLIAVVGLVALGVSTGWTIAIVPGLTLGLGSVVTYALYRQYRREVAEAWQLSTAVVAIDTPPLRAAPAQGVGLTVFRVVGRRGVCPLGFGVGDMVSVTPEGNVAPSLCTHAESALWLAVGEQGVDEWCCPIYDHLLVFRREAQAA